MTQQNIIIYKTADGTTSIALYARDGEVWLTQQQMAELFATSKQNISLHIDNIIKNMELNRSSVVKEYLTTAADGKSYAVLHYALPMILAVGFRVQGARGTQFRQWANRHLHSYLVKGFAIDDERLKHPNGRPDYFDELLEQIRDIRASEQRFYQKIRELFALSTDYDSTDKATQMFFAEVQNKLIYAVTEQTAAELICNRADANIPNMGLTSWHGSIVRKQDIYIAKNYLTKDELDTLNRLVTIFLEVAELRTKKRLVITMDYWRHSVDGIIVDNQFSLLADKGATSRDDMKAIALAQYTAFDTKRKVFAAQQADSNDEAELSTIEQNVKNRSATT